VCANGNDQLRAALGPIDLMIANMMPARTMPGLGPKAGSALSRRNRFQGQTSWHVSHP